MYLINVLEINVVVVIHFNEDFHLVLYIDKVVEVLNDFFVVKGSDIVIVKHNIDNKIDLKVSIGYGVNVSIENSMSVLCKKVGIKIIYFILVINVVNGDV